MCCQRSEQQGLLALRPPSPKLLVFTSTRDCDCSPDFGFSGCLNVRALSVSSSVTILSSDFPQAIWKGSPGRDSQAGGGRNVPHPPPRPPHCCLGISSRRGHPALRPPGGHTPPSALRSSSPAPCSPSPAFSVEGVASPPPEPFEFPTVILPDLIPAAVAGRVILGAKTLPEHTCPRGVCAPERCFRSTRVPEVCTPERRVPLCWHLGLVRSCHSVVWSEVSLGCGVGLHAPAAGTQVRPLMGG